MHGEPEVDLSQEDDFSAIWSTSFDSPTNEHFTASSLAGLDLTSLPTAETTNPNAGEESDANEDSAYGVGFPGAMDTFAENLGNSFGEKLTGSGDNDYGVV